MTQQYKVNGNTFTLNQDYAKITVSFNTFIKIEFLSEFNKIHKSYFILQGNFVAYVRKVPKSNIKLVIRNAKISATILSENNQLKLDQYHLNAT